MIFAPCTLAHSICLNRIQKAMGLDHAKLASQVARLVEIMVKVHFHFLALDLNKKFILQFDLLLKREFI